MNFKRDSKKINWIIRFEYVISVCSKSKIIQRVDIISWLQETNTQTRCCKFSVYDRYSLIWFTIEPNLTPVEQHFAHALKITVYSFYSVHRFTFSFTQSKLFVIKRQRKGKFWIFFLILYSLKYMSYSQLTFIFFKWF